VTLRLVTTATSAERDYYLDYVALRATYQGAEMAPLALDGGLPLIDGRAVGASVGLERVMGRPERAGLVMPSMMRDEASDLMNFSAPVLLDGGRWRLWYSSYDRETGQRHTSYSASVDGLSFPYPGQRLEGLTHPASATNTVVRVGGRYLAVIPDPASPPATWYGALHESPDGVTWQLADSRITPERYGETWELFELAGGEYGLLHRWNQVYSWTDAQGVEHSRTIHDPFTRLMAYSSSDDLGSFPHSRVLFAPDELDDGETQFYATSNVLQAGPYLITALMVLRDDLICAGCPATVEALGASRPVYGLGYSVWAWSADGGATWTRERVAFLGPTLRPGDYDQAHAWVDSVIQDGETMRLYYGAYEYGHKVYGDRSLALATLPAGRFVGWAASDEAGALRTRPVDVGGRSITINAAIEGGLWARLVDEAGEALLGFDWPDCLPMTGDELAHGLECVGDWADVGVAAVELVMERATVYAIGAASGD
jgi:hypothetical protein